MVMLLCFGLRVRGRERVSSKFLDCARYVSDEKMPSNVRHVLAPPSVEAGFGDERRFCLSFGVHRSVGRWPKKRGEAGMRSGGGGIVSFVYFLCLFVLPLQRRPTFNSRMPHDFAEDR